MNFSNEYPLSASVNAQDHLQGSPNAQITLVEYGDYQCPYCGQAYPIVKKMQEAFGDKLCFVFRNFPLSQIHEHAFAAAEAAEVADDYGKFWEMHDTLYEHQRHLDLPHLMQYAQDLGIDAQEFVEKLRNNEKAQRVKTDFMSGVESGVNGTPSFYINNYKYDGPWDYNSLHKVIEAILAH
ncbi:MAG: DsbA family protein [Chitinophagales bacterium]|nr:thioredoxin domain-containing protein [Bacteroidota bacterium]MCB9043919.1 thioredoxin domain-containing protein [Chitinophagales bacterium]